MKEWMDIDHYQNRQDFIDDMVNYKRISMGFYFNEPIDNIVFPDNIETLYFGDEFNQRIDNLPKNLIHLTVGKRFNQPLDNLPSKLETLFLREDFNQPLDFLPQSLRELHIGANFNHPLDNLPKKNLRDLFFMDEECIFNHRLDNLPESIQNIQVSWRYSHIDELKKKYVDKKIFINEYL